MQSPLRGPRTRVISGYNKKTLELINAPDPSIINTDLTDILQIYTLHKPFIDYPCMYLNCFF